MIWLGLPGLFTDEWGSRHDRTEWRRKFRRRLRHSGNLKTKNPSRMLGHFQTEWHQAGATINTKFLSSVQSSSEITLHAHIIASSNLRWICLYMNNY